MSQKTDRARDGVKPPSTPVVKETPRNYHHLQEQQCQNHSTLEINSLYINIKTEIIYDINNVIQCSIHH